MLNTLCRLCGLALIAFNVFGCSTFKPQLDATASFMERNHLRLWLTPIIYRGNDVWIGQISRDIGVRFAKKNLRNNKIDPDVDSARLYLAQDLLLTQHVHSIGLILGVEEAPRDTPRQNLTGDPYFTDGLRLVII